MDIKELAQAILDNEQLQVLCAEPPSEWGRVAAHEAVQAWVGSPDSVRLKPPPPTPVDLSVLVESGIDCTFSADGVNPEYVGALDGINGATHAHLYRDGGESHKYCTPRMDDHWHAWNGGDCPLPGGLNIEVRRHGMPGEYERTTAYGPVKCEFKSSIYAFKVTGLADGYCWPWDTES